MEKAQFLQKIDNLRGIVDDETVIDLYNDAEAIFEDHDDTISDYKDDLRNLKEEKSDLNDTIGELETEIEELNSQNKYELPSDHDNINTQLVFEKLFSNLDRIPISQLETFINQYSL